MDIKHLLQQLHPLERKVLPFLKKAHSLRELEKYTKLKPVEVMRALQWLSNKKAVMLSSKIDMLISLDKNGKLYVVKGLPEKRFLKIILKKPISLSQLRESKELNSPEIGASIGLLKAKQAIDMKDKIQITKQGEKLLSTTTPEEKLLAKLKTQALKASALSDQEKSAVEALKKRKAFVIVKPVRLVSFKLTDIGTQLAAQKIDSSNVIDRLTPAHLKLSGWKGKNFRRYDVKINVPRVAAGRKHHYKAFLDWVRFKFTTLGFKEMNGPIVESDFWDMDALFMPQFHSARDIHEGYYIKDPVYADLDPSIVARVKEAHETGGNTGSKGWRYKFDVKRTARHILRTHDTSISARTLASKNLKIPGKYFQIARCFRYDIIDATHLSDFNQVGGFVIEEGVNFTHLKGLLKMFAEEIGECDRIRIRPGYFPFTEPSCELDAYHPEMGWIELGGAGIFRPELVNPLVGKQKPVIAWGLGIDRLAMFKLGIKDIRDLFSSNLEFLKYTKVP